MKKWFALFGLIALASGCATYDDDYPRGYGGAEYGVDRGYGYSEPYYPAWIAPYHSHIPHVWGFEDPAAKQALMSSDFGYPLGGTRWTGVFMPDYFDRIEAGPHWQPTRPQYFLGR